MPEHDAGEPGIRPEVVQAIFSALTDMDPEKLDPLMEYGVTTAEYRQAVSLYANGTHLSLDHRERELKAMQVLTGERKLTKRTGWPDLFDGLTARQLEQLRDLHDALPDGGRAEYDRRYGRPEEI